MNKDCKNKYKVFNVYMTKHISFINERNENYKVTYIFDHSIIFR